MTAGPAWEGEAWGELVFPDELGRPLGADYVLRRFKALLTEAGLPVMRYHDLRHGAASLMAVSITRLGPNSSSRPRVTA